MYVNNNGQLIVHIENYDNNVFPFMEINELFNNLRNFKKIDSTIVEDLGEVIQGVFDVDKSILNKLKTEVNKLSSDDRVLLARNFILIDPYGATASKGLELFRVDEDLLNFAYKIMRKDNELSSKLSSSNPYNGCVVSDGGPCYVFGDILATYAKKPVDLYFGHDSVIKAGGPFKVFETEYNEIKKIKKNANI